MRVLIAHFETIPVTLYGGTERVIWGLGKELVKMGHNVTYLVKKGSSCDFAPVIHINERERIAEQIPNNIDVVHLQYAPEDIDKIKKPYVVTMHGNCNDYRRFDKNTIFVSRNHADRYGSESYVYNGLDWGDFIAPDLSKRQRTYFHFLGKGSRRIKNLRGSIKVIKKTKSEKLSVLGGVRFNFNRGVRFTLSPRVKFFGLIGGSEKFKLLKESKGLIFPVRWHEPFGLVIIESLYFGCPVFATPYGSLPEIVIDDVGYLSNDSDALAKAVEASDLFSRKTCHEYVVEKFNSKKMAESYLENYQRVLDGEDLNEHCPKLKERQSKKLLDWN